MEEYAKRRVGGETVINTSDETTRINLNLSRFVVDEEIMLPYEDENYLLHFETKSKEPKYSEAKSEENNPTNEILLDFLKARYENTCYKNTFIKSIKSITSRSKIKVKDLREGDITFASDCLVTAETIVIEPFSILNFEVESCSRQNDRTEIMAKRGELKIFIDEHSVTNIEEGMIIPCIVHDAIYSTGKNFIASFGGLFRAVPIMERYRITSKSTQNIEPLKNEAVKIEATLEELFKKHKPEKIAQAVELLTGSPTDPKRCEPSKHSPLEMLSEDLVGKCIEMDLTQFVTGHITPGSDSEVSEWDIQSSDEEVLMQIFTAIEKWTSFVIEFATVLDNANNKKTLVSILQSSVEK